MVHISGEQGSPPSSQSSVVNDSAGASKPQEHGNTSPKMDPSLKAKWVTALRSGEYAQCRNGLIEGPFGEPTSYCCLGVLWHLCGSPRQLDQLWADHVGELKHTLISMNDDEMKSFPEIADYIDANL